MVQEIKSVEESSVEAISAAFDEPTWIKKSRLEDLSQFKILAEERSYLFT